MSGGELFLNGVKLLVSEDIKEGVKSVAEILRSQPRWKETDYFSLDAKLRYSDRMQCHLMRDLTVEKMKIFSYTSEAISIFCFAFDEIFRNAFHHGIGGNPADSKGRVQVRVECSASYTSLSFINPKIEFNLEGIVNRQRIALEENPLAAHGRGLARVDARVDLLEPVDDYRGVRAVVFAQELNIAVLDLGGVVVLQVRKGNEHPSLARRLVQKAREFTGRDCDLVIDLTCDNNGQPRSLMNENDFRHLRFQSDAIRAVVSVAVAHWTEQTEVWGLIPDEDRATDESKFSDFERRVIRSNEAHATKQAMLRGQELEYGDNRTVLLTFESADDLMIPEWMVANDWTELCEKLERKNLPDPRIGDVPISRAPNPSAIRRRKHDLRAPWPEGRFDIRESHGETPRPLWPAILRWIRQRMKSKRDIS